MLRFKNSSQKTAILALLFLIILLPGISADGATQRLKVGVYNFAPLVGIDGTGRPQGLFVDILEHVAAKEGWQIEYAAGTWLESLERLRRNEIDLLTCIAYSDERAGFADFTSEFLFLDWGIVFKKKRSAIKTVFDLEGKRIGVLQGSIYTQGFKNLLEQFGITAQLVEKREYTEVFQAVDRGEVDAGINAQLYGLRLEEDYDIEATEIFFSPVKIRFAASKAKHREIISVLDRYIAALKSDKNSVYYASFDKWTTGMLRQKKPFPLWLKLFIGFIISAALVAFVFVLILKRQVLLKTAALRLSEEKFAKVFRSSPDTILLTDISDGRIVEVNEAFSKSTGYSRDEAIGRTTLELKLWLSENDRDRFISALRKDGKAENMESAIRHWNGNTVIGLLSAETIALSNKTYMISIFRDITARKQAETNLAREREFLAALLDNIEEAVVACDGAGKLVRFNEAAMRLHGMPAGPIPPEEWSEYYDLYEADGRTPLRKENIPLFRALQGQQVHGVEMVVAPKGRPPRTLIASGQALRDDTGRIIGAVVAMHDITERKRMEESLREKEALLRETGRIAKIGGWEFDPVTLRGTWTDEVARIYDLDPAQETSSELGLSFYHGEHRLKIERAIKEAIECGEPYDLELELITAEGNHKWVKTIGHPVKEEGKVVKIRGSFQDITERKETERLLRENEERYRLIFENSLDAVLLTAPDGSILSANPAACKIFERTEEEIRRAGRSGIIDASDPSLAAAVKERTRTGSFKGELIGLRRDGTKFPIEVATAIFKDRNDDLRTSMLIRDITKDKQMAEELRTHREYLEELVKARTAQLEEKISEIERMNRLFVDRELKMVELKEKIKYLEARKS